MRLARSRKPARAREEHNPPGRVTRKTDPLGRETVLDYIADSHNFRVRRLDTATGLIATVAGVGSGSQSFEDGVPATSVGIGFPWGISLDPEGSLLIADASGQIRRLVVSTGLLYRVAGSGVGFAGDGGPATFAIFSEPSSVVADATGNLFIADKNNHRVRHVANDVPVANAGPDQALEAGVSTASLDGSASSDNDMDALRFEWRDETGAILGTAPTVEVAAYGGRHEFTLTVADGWGGRGIDTVAVTAPATVQVTQPGQGKVIWPIGSTQTIRWIHNLGPVSAVQLELSRDGGHTWEVLSPAIANADATTGSFDWVVSGPRTKRAVVRVSAPGLANASDATDTRLMIR